MPPDQADLVAPEALTERGLGRLVRGALAWSLVNTALTRLGGLAVSVVLARLLVPSDYGDYAVALVVLAALLSCNELGVSLAIVRWPGDVRRIAGTVNVIALSASALATLLVAALAPLIATLLGTASAAGVIRVLCLAAFVDGVASVPAALLAREFRQRETTLISLSGLAVSACVSLGLASAGHGAFSLAWAQLAGNLLVAVTMIARCRPYPGLRVRTETVRPLLAFGLPLAGGSALVFLMLNLDYIVIGRMLGSTQLGLYFLAFNLASAPVTLLAVAVRRVAMPAFARTRDEGGDLSEALARAAEAVLMLVVPASAFLAVHATGVVRTVYGDRWTAAAVALALLAGFAPVRVIAELAYDLLATVGRADLVLRLQAGWLAALLVLLPLGAWRGGIAGVAVAHLVAGWVLVLPAFLLALRSNGLAGARLLDVGLRPVLAGGLVVASGLLVQRLVETDALALITSVWPALVAVVLLSLPLVRAERARGSVQSRPEGST